MSFVAIHQVNHHTVIPIPCLELQTADMREYFVRAADKTTPQQFSYKFPNQTDSKKEEIMSHHISKYTINIDPDTSTYWLPHLLEQDPFQSMLVQHADMHCPSHLSQQAPSATCQIILFKCFHHFFFWLQKITIFSILVNCFSYAFILFESSHTVVKEDGNRVRISTKRKHINSKITAKIYPKKINFGYFILGIQLVVSFII